MKKAFSFVLASALVASVAVTAFADDKKAPAAVDTKKVEVTKAEVGKAAPNFTLKTTDGKEWSLTDAAGKIVVLQWCNPECPACVNVSTDGTVAKMMTDLKAIDSNVMVVYINSSAARPESLSATAGYLKEHKIDVPALLDTEGKVGMMYGARTTPHCYVIDDKGVLRYQGAIDDAKGGKKGEMNYVVNAVKQIKAGETVSPDTTKPYGCSVKYKK